MTYEELLKNISAAGQNWSQWDLETAKQNPSFGASMFTYKNDYAAAKDQAGKTAANQGAEALRRQYGSYLGGSDGSKYYSLGGPSGYQKKEYQGSAAGSGITEILDKMKNYGQFQYDAPRPEYQNPYQQTISGLLGQVQDYGDFSYGPAPEYQNQYQQAISELLGKVQGYGPFSWSKETDPAYSAYVKQYRREGDRATADALAKAAAATGGQVSTAAVTAATQAGDYYAGQLADKIPELYENAYQRYLSDYKLLADKLGQTQQAEQYDYAKYRDQLGQYNTDRNQAYSEYLNKYNMLTDKLGQVQKAEQYDYAKYLDQLGQYNTDRNLAYNEFQSGYDRLGILLSGLQSQDDREYSRFTSQDQTDYARYLDQLNYIQNQDALQKEQSAQDKSLYQKQVDAILAAGAVPDQSMIAASGYDPAYVSAMANYYRQQAAGKSSGGSKSGGSGGKSMDYEGLFQAARASGNPQSFIANRYKSFGFSNSGGLWNEYRNWLDALEESESEDESGSDDASGQSGGSGGPAIDMNSVLALGYGPLDAEGLNRLVASGEVEEYQEENQIRFRRKAAGGPKKAMAWGK